ncbi:MAG TPA: hypothetical protein VFB14_27770 [Bryobacteraceae bacterium]|jgi:hypothetical protein|nr:hypothetical protein [Bryobacteraceae bacterium]
MSSDTQEYVYRHAVIAGEDAWRWQQKGTLVWAQTKTEQEAIQAIQADARNHGVTAQITDVSIMRPRATSVGEREAIEAGKEAYREAIRTAEQRPKQLADMTRDTYFWRFPAASQMVAPEAKLERQKDRQQRQDRDDLGFSF